VQFVHRTVAYVLWFAVLLHVIDVWRTARDGAALAMALMLAAAVTFQAALGIATLLHGVPIRLALMHQAMAIIVLGLAVVHAQRVRSGMRPEILRMSESGALVTRVTLTQGFRDA
jgi:cytochrome c oxidase assembly protein subunit 15